MSNPRMTPRKNSMTMVFQSLSQLQLDDLYDLSDTPSLFKQRLIEMVHLSDGLMKAPKLARLFSAFYETIHWMNYVSFTAEYPSDTHTALREFHKRRVAGLFGCPQFQAKCRQDERFSSLLDDDVYLEDTRIRRHLR